MTTFQSIGFIGLGLMGNPMAGQLATKLPAETKLHVYDTSEQACERLASEHPDKVVICANAKDVADRSEVIFTMVPEGSHVRSVYLSPETGVLCSALNSKILIDTSTIDVATSLAIKSQLLTQHPEASFYDAPVSGGVNGAVAGTIAFFVGCNGGGGGQGEGEGEGDGKDEIGASPPDPNLARLLTPLLTLMGRTVIPCGGPGLGLAAKLSNNYLSGIIAIAASEALDMGMRSGLDPRVLNRVFNAGTAQNAICDAFCPCPGVVQGAPSSNAYKGGFKVQLMRKDVALALDMAARVGSRNVLGEKGLETYTAAMQDPECRDRDSRVVYRYLGGREDWLRDFGG